MTVERAWRRGCQMAFRERHHRERLRRQSTHLYQYTDPQDCRQTGNHVWLDGWNRPLYVWMPSLDIRNIVTMNKRMLVPMYSRDAGWNDWLRRLMVHLGLRKRCNFASGKPVKRAGVRSLRAMVAFRVRNKYLDARVVRVKTRRSIYA